MNKRLLAISSIILAVILLVSVSTPAAAKNSPYSASLGTLFNSNEAIIKQDFINREIGGSFNMHFLSTVTISGTIWAYYIKMTAGGQFAIGLAKSTDGVTFTDNGFVLTPGSGGSVDDQYASFPGVWYESGTWYMVYEAKSTAAEAKIGYATSTDGVNFTKHGVILSYNTTGWEHNGIGTPSLYKSGSTWYLYYHGFDGTDCRVGVATGTSLTSLTKYAANPVVDTSASGWDSGTIGHRDIVYDNGYYYMVYEGSTDQPYGSAKWSWGFARSTDLLNWTKYSQNPVLPQTLNTWGNDGPSFITVGGVPYIYYRGVGPAGNNVTRRASIANELNGRFTYSWENESMPYHSVGRLDSDCWSASTALDAPGYLSFGPYMTSVRAGENTAIFKMQVDNITNDNLAVATLEVVDADNSGQVLASRTITRQQFTAVNHDEFFIVPFYLPSNNHRLEFRVNWADHSYTRIDKIALVGSSNIAPSAAATASSQFSGSYSPSKAIDGSFAGADWASSGETTPWITLTWPFSQTIDRIHLYDRTNLTDTISGSQLEFSDGTTVSVGALPNNGQGKTVTFAGKTVTWVKFKVTSGSGLNVGLNEIEAYPVPQASPNLAPDAAVSSSSQYNSDFGPWRAVDGAFAGTDWASNGQLTPWIQLTWPTSQSISKVSLYDRVNLTDSISAGTLTFSDGTSVSVGALPNDGSVKEVSFASKNVTWVRFTVTSGSGLNVGLNEIEVR